MLADAREVAPDGAVILYRYDREATVLRPTMASPKLAGRVERLRDEGPESAIWRAFVEGETSVVDGRETDGERDPLPVDSAVVVPIEDFGVLVIDCLESAGTLHAAVVDARQIAVTSRLALERLRFQRELETIADDVTSELERESTRTTILRDLQQLVVRSQTREELERAVCERLAEVPGVSTAVITGRDGGTGHDPRWQWAGDAPSYLDAVFGSEDHEREPTHVAVQEREPKVVADVSTNVQRYRWRQLALDYGIGAVVSTPLQCDGVFYGALSVYLTDRLPADESRNEFVAEGGELVAFGIAANERQTALVASHGVEVKLECPGESCVNCRVAAEADARLVFESVVPSAVETATAYVTVVDGKLGDVLDLPDSSVLVADATYLSATSTGPFVELTLTDEPLESELATLGVQPISLTADRNRAHVHARLSPTHQLSTVIEVLGERSRDVTVLSQRRTEPGTAATDPATLLSKLSDRQREIVEAAHRQGYFQSPRETSGEELADRFDMAPSTFYEHVRAAQRNLFDGLFASED